MTDWQPIETAPKDGTTVLISGPTRSGKKRFIHAAAWRLHDSGSAYVEVWKCPVGIVFDDDVTHWMPLPPPPRLSKKLK